MKPNTIGTIVLLSTIFVAVFVLNLGGGNLTLVGAGFLGLAFYLVCILGRWIEHAQREYNRHLREIAEQIRRGA